MNLRTIAKALGGIVNGTQVLAPGPHHSKHDRSLAVFLDPNAPDLFRVHSHAGDDWKLCRDYVKERLGLADVPFIQQRIDVPKIHESLDGDVKARTLRALSIWGEARSIDGTPAQTYLAKRGIDLSGLPPGLSHALRWHPQCPWGTGRYGCMVGLMTDAVTGEPKAIHRTAITASGEKLGKKMLGPSAGCVIRLWPDETVTSGLVIGEGIETTLAAATRLTVNHTRLVPAWAACTAGGMARLPVLPGIECLTLLVDNDASEAGQRAAEECSQRWTTAGREVIRLVPNVTGTDFADILNRRAA